MLKLDRAHWWLTTHGFKRFRLKVPEFMRVFWLRGAIDRGEATTGQCYYKGQLVIFVQERTS